MGVLAEWLQQASGTSSAAVVWVTVGIFVADTILRMTGSSYVSFEQRMAEKEAARRADDLAVAEGRKTPEQVRRDNESFAFGPDVARLNFASLHPLVESVIALTDEPAGGSDRA